MITAERIYAVFGITHGPWEIELSYLSIVNKNLKIEICNFETGDAGDEELKGDMALIAAAPIMLVALINEVISLDCEDILKDMIINMEISEEEKMMISVIESADSKNRKWPELLKELLK